MSFFSSKHTPVLIEQVLELYRNSPPVSFIDGTLGMGGHSAALLREYPSLQRLMGIDRDGEALAVAREILTPWDEKVTLRQDNFSNIASVAEKAGFTSVDGILLDLGVSSLQLDVAERGFSFMRDGPLDMRMGREESLLAASIVNEWTEEELRHIFWRYGEEKEARLAARLIVRARPLVTTSELVEALLPLKGRVRPGVHYATRIFQALRLVVNGELDALTAVLPRAINLLSKGGILAVITFHSLEDRIVKECFRSAASDKESTRALGVGLFIDKEPTVRLLTRKPIIADDSEVEGNPRSRSAKLRAIEKL